MRGVTNLRGDIVSVIDMRSFLGLEAASPPTARMLVVRLLDEPFSAGLHRRRGRSHRDGAAERHHAAGLAARRTAGAVPARRV